MKPENVTKAAAFLRDLSIIDAGARSEMLLRDQEGSTICASDMGTDLFNRLQLAGTEAIAAVRKKIAAELHALGVKVD